MSVQERVLAIPVQVQHAAAQVRERLPEDVGDAVRTGIETRARPAVTRSRVAGWELVRAAVDAVIAVLRWVPRALSSASDVAEIASERGVELSERARDVAAAVPPSRRVRRRRRGRLVLVTAGGLGFGVVLGWLLARRAQRLRDGVLVEVADVAPNPVDGAVEDAGQPADRDAAVDADDAGTATTEVTHDGDRAAR